MAINPRRPQALAHHLHTRALRQPGAVQYEGESGTAIVERGVVGHTVLGAGVDPGGNVLSLLTQQAALTPRLAGRNQAPVLRPGNAHLQQDHRSDYLHGIMKWNLLLETQNNKRSQQEMKEERLTS